MPPTARKSKQRKNKAMQDPKNKQKNQDTVQLLEKKEKKDYQSPVCEQHKPLDHVRVWHKKSLPS